MSITNKFKLIWNRQIAWHAVDVNHNKTVSYNADTPMYPASAFKIFIAADLLRSAVDLDRKVSVAGHNARESLFPVNNQTMADGDMRSVSELLYLMLHNSDNPASNTLANISGLGDFGKTDEFLTNAQWTMFSHRIAVTPRQMTECIVNNAGILTPWMLRAAPGILDNAVLHKGGNMNTGATRGPKWLRRFMEINYKTVVGLVVHDDMSYAVSIMTKCNAAKGSGAAVNLLRIQKKIEKQLRAR